MKKLFVLALIAMVSGCACFECDDDGQVLFPSRRTQVANQVAAKDCDYFDGKTCYHYVYRNVERPVVRPAPVKYRPCNAQTQTHSCGCAARQSNCGCADKVSETREPVEVIYKKTTYRTVYEPKTYSQVSYEKEPYHEEVVEQPAVVEQPVVQKVIYEQKNTAKQPSLADIIDNDEILVSEIK